MLWAVASVCFFGFFRAGELTAPSLILTFEDVAVDNWDAPTNGVARNKNIVGHKHANRLYVIDASRRTRATPSKRDRRLEALAPLLLCYSRAYHSIVD